MHGRLVSGPLQGRAAPRRVKLRRLRAGVFRLGSFVGLDTGAVVRFSEVISGRRWRRCGSADLEQVLANFVQLAERVAISRSGSDAERPPAPGAPRR